MRRALASSPGRWLTPVAVVSAAALVGAGTVYASVFAAGPLVQVADHPFPGTSTACDQVIARSEALGSVNYPDAEVEPYVTADPRNPDHLIASFQQDRWNDGGANGLIAAVSNDGGAHWSLASAQPRFTVCEGATSSEPGPFQRASDPWVSIGPDGIAYSIAIAFNANGPAFGGASGVLVSRSTDGGQTWQPPVSAELDTSTTVLNDKESVTADPLRAGTAYAVWDRLVSPNSHANPDAFTFTRAFRGPAMFSETTDGGVTWSQGRVVFDPGQNNQTIGNQIVVPTAGPARGVLIDGFALIVNRAFGNPHRVSPFSVAVIRSTDGGATFSGPIVVSPLIDAPVSIAGHAVRTGDILPGFAAGPEGNLYAVWQDGRFSPTGAAKIAFSMSTDGGLHWSTPIRVDQSPGDAPAFTPYVHVASDGTVGVTYYDLENATAARPGLTDEFIVHCHPATDDCANPASWAAGGETRLSTTGSFDMTTAPDAGGYFTGDYEGLTSSGTTFDSFFVMARPIATRGATDPFATTAG
ncbi:MAG TPA: sialidase family protein [Candidatus Dormibacteraeota bacterium]|nr:sialidase family protein [Candidatus Dormibacteraeota bacterium]